MNVRLLTVAQAAGHLGVSTKTVQRMYRAGEVPHVRLGTPPRWVRISQTDLDAFIARRRIEVAM
ncbi:helix-turn-helix domain-containing protein [Rhodococcus sp. UNC363MFTsu5.1]|uniref:helix-turn-helix domain-containing protein n=1 Tax=Rhodococcus sp. UNC363MFTsu5.1 TaxID=1449069 RepID=UPI00048366AC